MPDAELCLAAGPLQEHHQPPGDPAGQIRAVVVLNDAATARFEAGQPVLVANPPAGAHTRLPGYLRGHRGTVESVAEGNYTYFCSTGGDGLGDPVPVYIVRFEAAELWGETAEASPSPLYAELYEPYLLPITD